MAKILRKGQLQCSRTDIYRIINQKTVDFCQNSGNKPLLYTKNESKVLISLSEIPACSDLS